MNFTKNNLPLEPNVSGDILTSDQMEWSTDISGFLLAEAEKQFNFEFDGSDSQAILDKTLEKKEAGITLNRASISTLKLLQSSVKSEKLKENLQYAIDALEDDGKLSIPEGVIAGIKIALGIKDEKKN